jgi:hypothetical protein
MEGFAMNARLAWLAAVAAALGAYVIIENPLHMLLGTPESGVENDAALQGEVSNASGPGQPEKLNPLHGLEADRFRAIIEQPLFNPGRAPRPVEPPPPPPAPPVEAQPTEAPQPSGPTAEDFNLLAVSNGPMGRVAVLRVAASGEVLYLREGNAAGTWTLLSVTDRSVVIGTAEQNVTINLFEALAPVGQATATDGGDDSEQALPAPAPEPVP